MVTYGQNFYFMIRKDNGKKNSMSAASMSRSTIRAHLKPPIHATVFAVIVMLWWTAQTSAKMCRPTHAIVFATVFTQSCEFQ